MDRLEEEIKEIEELWVEDYVDWDTVNKLVAGYKEVKSYDFGPYQDVTIRVYQKGKKRRFVVVYNPTGAAKKVTDSWAEAKHIALLLTERVKRLDRIFR